jgi:hypothetical protein
MAPPAAPMDDGTGLHGLQGKWGQMMRNVKTCLLGAILPLAGAISTPAQAVEGAASLYVPGTGGPATAVMPPLEGVYFDDTIYIYNGSASASKEFVVGGNVVAGLDATIVADFLTTLVVPSTNILGGTLSMGVTVPVGAPMIPWSTSRSAIIARTSWPIWRCIAGRSIPRSRSASMMMRAAGI